MFFAEKFEFKEFGDNYKDSFIELKLLSRSQNLEYLKAVAKYSKNVMSEKGGDDAVLDQSEKLIEKTYELVKAQFINGYIFDGISNRAMTAEDIDDLPPKVIGKLIALIRGMEQKKSTTE